MDEWIFKRPPYNLGIVELPGWTDRFDFRIMVRYDRSLLKKYGIDFEKIDKIYDAISEARDLLEVRLKETFGEDFLLDDPAFLCGPRTSPQGVEEYFIINGANYFRDRRK